MSDRQDGGPAFPCAQDVLRSDEGMSLRDWFAGQALAGMLANPDNHVTAATAYDFADAMLAERGKR